MSLSQRLSPFTARLAHILTVKQTTKALAARSNPEKAPLGIFFAGPVGDIYQVTQWISVFERIADELPSVFLIKDARVAAALAKLTDLPIRIAGHADAIEALIPKIGLKALFYVNNNLANFSALRLPSVAHIHLSHGESEKVSMVSNQLKAYDYCFVAGQAAVDRILGSLTRFDSTHLIEVGRPQLDDLLTAVPFARAASRQTVLYAPTWEGDRPAMAYSSLSLVGESWVEEILNDSTLRLIYRPHPKTGSRDSKTLDIDRRIRKAIRNAAASTPTAGHMVDEQTDYNPALASADVAIFDVSAMSLDFQILRRPLFIFDSERTSRTVPALPRAKQDQVETALTGNILPLLHSLLTEGLTSEASVNVKKHFGDTTKGAALSTLRNEIKRIIN